MKWNEGNIFQKNIVSFSKLDSQGYPYKAEGRDLQVTWKLDQEKGKFIKIYTVYKEAQWQHQRLIENEKHV